MLLIFFLMISPLHPSNFTNTDNLYPLPILSRTLQMSFQYASSLSFSMGGPLTLTTHALTLANLMQSVLEVTHTNIQDSIITHPQPSPTANSSNSKNNIKHIKITLHTLQIHSIMKGNTKYFTFQFMHFP